MADLQPFRAIRYNASDVSALIAPPYDVLDKAGKEGLLARSDRNVVAIDLPFLPPKTLGPAAVYEQAAATLQAWLADGTLTQDAKPALYAYSQTFDMRGRTFERRGLIGLVRLEAFSTPSAPTQIVPHEKTYPGPIEDRLHLMRATGAQLSPIFGLFPDEDGSLTARLHDGLGAPAAQGTLDGVVNKLWPVTNEGVQGQVIGAMKTNKIYIADGHHRYTTALAYKHELEAKHGGPLPADHPANFCLFVLVSMHDPGCVILPTHRIVGGLKSFDIATLRTKLSGVFAVDDIDGDENAMASFEDSLASDPYPAFGLFDGTSRRMYLLRLTKPDVLHAYEPNQSAAWRGLDVSILRRYLLDEIIGPTFAAGREMTLAYTADPTRVPLMTDGTNYQIALLLRPTPLEALRQLGDVGEVMPQKSTYFYPKVATGLTMNPLG
ncbi:MAG TPA: DUF1015 domain-containing protein [Tepidisphaeraceae bacterium]|jgi:uncharacterized protein (DUF1015 family)